MEQPRVVTIDRWCFYVRTSVSGLKTGFIVNDGHTYVRRCILTICIHTSIRMYVRTYVPVSIHLPVWM